MGGEKTKHLNWVVASIHRVATVLLQIL